MAVQSNGDLATSWRMKWRELREDASFGLNVLMAGIAMAGAGGAATLVKSRLYPAARPVGNLHQRLLRTSAHLARPVVKFDLNPYQLIHPRRALILQGRNQEGKTTLLRECIPWWRRFGPFAYRGLYLNGAQGKGVETFEKWLTTEMFGATTTRGCEIAFNLVQYSESQVFRSVLERVGLPIAPKPAIVVVDQFEELLKRFPVQALDWANTLTNQHTRDNLTRVIFVCNSDAGSQTLLNLNQGTRFDRVIMEQVSGQGVIGLIGLDKELFQNCSGNIGNVQARGETGWQEAGN